MSKARMEAARELIQEKKYAEARVILQTVDHPQAKEWIAKIDALAPQPRKPSNAPVIVLGALVVLAVLFFGGVILYSQRTNIPFLAAMLATPTQTPTTTPTLTPTPVATNTPSSTATPTQTNTPLPTSTIAATWTPTALPDTPVPDLGAWIVQTQVSSLTDAKQLTFYLTAENSVNGGFLTETPILVLRCKNGVVDAYINVTMQIEGDSTGPATAQIRFDKDVVQNVTMDRATGNDALFFRNPAQWIHSMGQHAAMAFGFVPFESGEVDTTFSLQGIRPIIQQLTAACP